MEKKLYVYHLHNEICELCMKLLDLSLVNDKLIFRGNGSIFDPDDYIYVDFEGRKIYGECEDEDDYYVITGVFLWGDCSIDFRVAPADAPEVGSFVSWSDYNEDILKKIVNNLEILL